MSISGIAIHENESVSYSWMPPYGFFHDTSTPIEFSEKIGVRSEACLVMVSRHVISCLNQ